MTQGSFIVPADVLRDLAARIFEAHDVPESDAQRVADCLVQADLRGVSSHGVGRIPIYTERLRKGFVKARPQMKLERALTVGPRIYADDTLGDGSGTRSIDRKRHLQGTSVSRRVDLGGR